MILVKFIRENKKEVINSLNKIVFITYLRIKIS